MSDLSKDLHPTVKRILEKTKRLDDWDNCLDNGDGYLFKFDSYSDGTYIECIRSTNWGDATGEKEGMFLIEQGNLIMPPHSEIEDNKKDLKTIHDIVWMIMAYSGVESHYGGGDEVWLESSLQDMRDEGEREKLTIVPDSMTIDQYIIENYT